MANNYFKLPLALDKVLNKEELPKCDLEKSIHQHIDLLLATYFGEYKYDEKGRLIEEKRLDEEKSPIDFFAPIIQYKYDSDDRVIEKSFHDAKGALTSRMMDDDDENEIAIIRFAYLDDKTTASVFKKDGSLIKH